LKTGHDVAPYPIFLDSSVGIQTAEIVVDIDNLKQLLMVVNAGVLHLSKATENPETSEIGKERDLYHHLLLPLCQYAKDLQEAQHLHPSEEGLPHHGVKAVLMEKFVRLANSKRGLRLSKDNPLLPKRTTNGVPG